MSSARSPHSHSDLVRPQGCDRFGKAIDDYIEAIRTEAQKALSLAKNELAAGMNQQHERDLDKLRNVVDERDRALGKLRAELDSRKESHQRLSKQLRAFVTLLSKRNRENGGIHFGIPDDPSIGIREIVKIWRLKAHHRRREAEGTHITRTLYETKLKLRVCSEWRLFAVMESMARISAERLENLQRSKDLEIQQTSSERDQAKAEVNKLMLELDVERSRRGEFISKVRTMFAAKFAEFSNELIAFGAGPPGSGLLNHST